MSVDLVGMAFACLVMLLVGFVYGSIRMTRYQDERVEQVVRQNDRLVVALGYVYDLFELPLPNLDVPEPERPVSWLQQRRQRPLTAAPPDPHEALSSWEGMNAGQMPVEPEPVTRPVEPETEPGIPVIRPQPGPRTAPDLKKAAAVAPPAPVPAPVDDYERWKRESDEQFARDLAAIRGEGPT